MSKNADLQPKYQKYNGRARISLIRMMENTKKPSKTRGKLEVPMEAAMPCKKGTKKSSSFQETEAKSCESHKNPKTKHACIAEGHESTRQRLESFSPKMMKITSQAKEKV